jgi:hypothetical protein
MFEATANEFPFVEALPKREKGRVAKAIDQVREFCALQEKHGSLLPALFIVGVLGISRQRVYQLIEGGQLKAVQHHGQWYIPESVFLEFVNTERKNGRPVKLPTSNSELWKNSLAFAKSLTQK